MMMITMFALSLSLSYDDNMMGKTSHDDDDDDDDDDGGMRSDCKPLMGKNLKPLLN